MKKATQHTRWHYFDEAGKKIIQQFRIDATPPSPWARGTGPHSPEARSKIEAHIAKTFAGKPKPATQKEKMRLSATGKTFTEEHKQSMSVSWNEERREKFRNTLQSKKLRIKKKLNDNY